MHTHDSFGLGHHAQILHLFVMREHPMSPHVTNFLYLYTIDFVTHRCFILTMHIMHNITFKN